MRFPSIDIHNMKNKQKYRGVLYFCIIIMMISGIAGATIDRDVIVGFKNKPGPSEEALIHAHGGSVKKAFHLIPAIAAKMPENNITKIKKDARITYIEDDKIYEMATDEYVNSWGVQHIGSDIVHSQGITGAGIKVAVLDTGIDCSHEDLKNNCISGYDFVFDDTNTFDDNDLSHGTHVAGIVAAEKNGVGIVGVAPDANVYAVKVLDGGGFGSESWIISGLQWAVDNNMDIATMSIQGPDSIYLHNATDAAYKAGVLLVAAAGNTNGKAVAYPAGYDSVIAVTATDSNDQRASFSPIDPKIELAAPGVNINSTIKGGYGILNGTSMAAPFVTGVSALVLSTDFPDVNLDGIKDNKDVREILQNTAKDLGDPGRDNIYGFGLVDATNAILGYSAYDPVDISITKDDGVSTVVSGEGTIYKYIITVKNNGPLSGGLLNALNVRVSDIWPVGFTRGAITTSQGSCDITNPTNFTCYLGKIAKGGIVTITAEYSVYLNTFEGNYNNEVFVNSITPDFNNGNNNASDIDIIGEVRLNLVRHTGPEINDAKIAYISKGNYSINIHNINISKIDMKVYDNGVVRKDLSSSYKFSKSADINFNMNAGNALKFVFIPYGSKGSIGYVTIRRLS